MLDHSWGCKCDYCEQDRAQEEAEFEEVARNEREGDAYKKQRERDEEARVRQPIMERLDQIEAKLDKALAKLSSIQNRTGGRW